VRRHLIGLCVWVVLCIGTATAILVDVRPQFGAATQLVLEQPARADDRADIVRRFHQLVLDDARAQTQLHLILSERVLRIVFDALHLAQSPELSSDREGYFGRLVPWLENTSETEVNANVKPAFSKFQAKVRARRIGLTYVMEISYWAQDPVQAKRVVNAVAAAYLRETIDSVAMNAFRTVAVKHRATRMQAEDLMAASAVRTGVLPDADFPDAAVRLLGAGALTDAMFPSPVPVLAMALCLGVISGLFVIAAASQVDRRILSRRRLRAFAGLEAIGATPRVPRNGRGDNGQSRDPRWTLAVDAVRAAIVRTGRGEPQRRIGILGSSGGPGPDRLAADLTCLVGNMCPPDPALSDSMEENAAIAIVTLPQMEGSGFLDTLATCDAAILVIEAGRATVDEVVAALEALRVTKVALAGTLLTR
jgi:capsular polysaccharide biosynthesis protein